MSRVVRLGVGLALLSLLAGCSAYVDDYHFAPRPAVADIPATQPNEPPMVSTLASIIGVRRQDDREFIPASIEVRLQVRNNGPQMVVFEPQALELTNGLFVRFPQPLVRPPQAWTLGPSQEAIVSAYFPFPPGHSWGDTDLESLQLRVVSTVGGRKVDQVIYFRRALLRYYDRYYDYPPYYWSGGVVFVHRRR